MSGIISILRDTPNNVSLVRIITTDTLATVLTANYIKKQMPNIVALNGGPWQWYKTDMLMISASDNNAIFTFTDATFSSLNEYSGGSSGIVSPGLQNQLAWYAANGSTVSGLTSIANRIMTTDGGGIPNWRNTLPSGLTIPGFATIVGVQRQTYTYGVDSGIANAYVVTLSPAPAALTDGMYVAFQASHNNNAASTINVNSLGAVNITLNNGSSLVGGEIVTNGDYLLLYNATTTSFMLLTPSTPAAVTDSEIQNQSFTYGVDSGAANAYVVTLAPAPISYIDGMYVAMKVSNANTNASTLNLNALGVKNIVTNANAALVGGELLLHGDYLLIYNSSFNAFVLINSSLTTDVDITAAQIQNQAFTYAIDSGAVNAYAITLSPAPAGYVDGQLFAFQPANTNTGASTINVNGLGATTINLNTGFGLTGGEIESGGNYLIQYNLASTSFVLLNPTPSPFGVTAQELQTQFWTYVLDTGAANAYAVTLSPAPTSYTDGLYIVFRAAHANTGASTIDVNSLGVKNIVDNTNAALTSNEILLGSDYILMYSVHYGAFIIINPNVSSGSGVTAAQVQQQAVTYAVDSGSGSGGQYVVDLSPVPASYTDGMYVAFRAANTFAIGLSQINVNSLGFVPIFRSDGTNIHAQDILAGGDYILIYNSSLVGFVLINPTYYPTIPVTQANIQQQSFTFAVDSGAANAYVITPNPAYASYANGIYVCFKATNANSGASTINVNGLGVQNIVTNDNVALASGAILANGDYILIYNTTFSAFVLINSSLVTVTGQALTRTNDTNVLITLGGSASTSLVNAASLTMGWSGTLAVSRGGSGRGSATAYAVLCGGTTTTGAHQSIAGVGTSGQVLTSTGAGALPTMQTPAVTRANVQNQTWNYAPDTAGVSNNYVITLASVPIALTNGMFITFTPLVSNTGASTINVNSLGVTNIVTNNNAALVGGEILVNGEYLLIYDGNLNAFVLINPSPLIVNPAITQVNVQTFTTTGAYTYTPTAGTKYIIMELQAAGGGSGGSTGAGSQSAVAGAGGGGAYLKLLVTSANIGASITGNVGAGGTAGASGNNAGGAGGNTTAVISASTWTAAGGGAGSGQASSAVPQISGTAGQGGAVTTGSNATLLVGTSGGAGYPGFSSGAAAPLIGTAGGSAMLGVGGQGVAGNNAAFGGGKYGGGASGGSNGTGGSIAGAAGGDGIVIVTEFISS